MMSPFHYYVSGRKGMPRRLVFFLAAGSVIACGAAGAATAPTTPPGNQPPTMSATINATPQIAFSPSAATLTQGGSVTFAFGSVGHNVYFDNDPAGAPANIPGANSNTSVARVFPTVGVYAFTCHIHPEMHGTVTVVAADTTGY
jgi:plastocyanin